MKLNSTQFKRKSAYFLPFVQALGLFHFNLLDWCYKVEINFIDGHSRTVYLRSLSYGGIDIKSALFSRFDTISFGTARQFFISFLSSCNYRQLATFINMIHSEFHYYGDELYRYLLSEIPNMVGENLFRAALPYVEL